ncbi:hypothetical protein KZ483_25885 [Paenibacillus sp. sptzw28]|uniref:hypothetical protein n=1 Tax=Paenibacillus sp. sptzw28 TaxID=715179 RepID=UPI001C6F23C8|nr:hypothetical protein [Paenibacillus sp. sptzw28]QYR21106.1 hypothetical protein KZ483_25885 [Paenibacillus sp. sptzw28]
MGKISLLVGNGFTLDFIKDSDLNSSRPLHCFQNPNQSNEINYDNYLDKLHFIKNELFPLRNQYSNDFEAIKIFLESISGDTKEIEKDCQLRRFLALSYSLFQLKSEKYDMSSWKWARWIQNNRQDITFAVSFNYDLILENAFKNANIKYYRTGSNEPFCSVPIIKPHGSIDFDVPNFFQGNVWGIHTRLNDTQFVKIVPKWERYLPRLEADMIPPSQKNYQRKLKWTETGFKLFNNLANSNNISYFMIGHSYCVEDREEVDHFIDRLQSTTVVHIMHPYPSSDLLDKLESKRLKYKYPMDWDSLPNLT